MAVIQDATDAAVSVGGIGTGVGSTVLVRRQFDQTGETTILRPSVLWGLGTGTAALLTPYILGRNDRSMLMSLLEDYGEGALAAGAFSAVNPKGGGVQLPTV